MAIHNFHHLMSVPMSRGQLFPLNQREQEV